MGTWYNQTIDDAAQELNVTLTEGLSSEEAKRRLEQHGPNQLQETAGKNALDILRDQLTELMVLLLIGAALVSGAVLGEWEDAIVILVIVVLNTLLGFRQEYKAEKAMEALKKMAVPEVRVRRGGEVMEVSAEALVPGDMLLLEAGALVPADCRLVEAANLKVRESALTGEAEAVNKRTDALAENDPALGDRTNMVYRGTIITYGRGVGLVTATGMETELGHIAGMIQTAEQERTVLQKRLDHLSKILVGAALALIGVVAVEGYFLQNLGVKDIFLTAVSMAVAAIPEGLPAVVTIALALGAQRMLKRNALIRKLPAVETLGSVTVICSDKTGTLTQNRMIVHVLQMPEKRHDLPKSMTAHDDELTATADKDPSAGLMLAGACLCSDAEIQFEDDRVNFKTLGDPTEGALVAAAAWVGWSKKQLTDRFPRNNEAPFDSDRKRMTTVHALPDTAEDLGKGLEQMRAWAANSSATAVAFCKGATDSVLKVCDRIWLDGETKAMSDDWRDRIEQQNEALADNGIRVLAVAMRDLPSPDGSPEELESGMIYVGLVGMLDPLRDEVRAAVKTCREAGIRPVMITGDHPLIARHIGTDLGLDPEGRFLTGKDLAAMDRAQLEKEVKTVSVYARVAPEHKLNIVDSLQKNGEVVAMTGDGVNDAPALKEADIGVAMGITGTDVSKEAADMVLRDDNFATIVAAVEEGRIIFDNILRFVRYILASNSAEVMVMLAAPLLKLPLALLPVQILWMNLVTDGLPALALGVEPGERDVMQRPPRDPKAPIMDWAMGAHILWVGGLMAALALVVGLLHYTPADAQAAAASLTEGGSGHGAHGSDAAASVWQTMLFTTLVFSQLTLALAERSQKDSAFTIGFFSNRYMAVALVVTLLLQLGVVYLPVMQRFFNTVPLALTQLLTCFGFSIGVFAAVEIEKAFRRRSAPAIAVPTE